MIQRQQHADGAMQCRQRVANRHAYAHRHTARLGRQMAQAAHGLADHAEARQIAVRAGLAVARDTQNDQAGVELVQFVWRHAPAFQRAGAKVLDQHVGLGNQAARNVLRLLLAQIQRHRFLVARLHLPPHRGAVLQKPPVAQRIARSCGLDLDDLGTKVTQRLAAERAGDELAHLHHTHTIQCTRRQRGC
ncbi:hypothetical protein SDC9_158397 [bioreactor metagenome]|uniref:Uncharacterized protein n=1 Tax=bioreactor metagenome TaxID=1076179 RepID=A0A645FBV0_9ZZZZ